MLLTRWPTGFTTSPRGTVTRPGWPNAPVRSAPSCAGDRVGTATAVGGKAGGTRMINWGDVAALVAAFFFAVLVCAAVYVLIRLARLLTETRRLGADLGTRSDGGCGRAQSAVDRAHQQLDATSTVTESMDELNTGMSQLSAQVSTLAGLGRAVATGPAGRAAAFVYGVRHAVRLRRDGQATPANAIPAHPKSEPASLSSVGGRR